MPIPGLMKDIAASKVWLSTMVCLSPSEKRESRRERASARGGCCWALTWVGVAIAALTLNYLTFVAGLDRTSPPNAEVIIQLAPMLPLLGGVVIFRERFSRLQAAGLVGLTGGLLMFFNEQRAQWQAESAQQAAT